MTRISPMFGSVRATPSPYVAVMQTRSVINRSAVGVTTRDPDLRRILIATAHLASQSQRPARRSYERPHPAPVRVPRRDVFRAVALRAVALVLTAVLTAGVVVLVQREHRDSQRSTATRSGEHRDLAGALAIDASRLVQGGTRPSSGGRFLITAVTGPTSDNKEAAATLAMQTSRENAIAAANDCLGAPKTSALTISTEGITGGSGGLMFTLAAMDAVTAGELTRGRRVAGTGRIGKDGTVGGVLRVEDKARAAAGAGADLFLVPAGQITEGRRGAGSLRVVGVRTLDEAVRVLTGSGCSAWARHASRQKEGEGFRWIAG